MKIKLAVTTFSFALLISCCASSSVLPDPEHHTYDPLAEQSEVGNA